ncbi:MFS transporter [Amycolatopsis thermoflava]|uniref:MFS transporter n=1 Tax=Amycolatopsis thermoflava TaxID=84480 RepID=UPI0003FB6976|nr:MFS transporter [Amycolatopsis thermoflava]
MTTSPDRAAAVSPARAGRVGAPWLALLAGPLSLGIAGPALVLGEVAGDLGVGIPAATWLVTAFGWGVAVGTPLMAGLLARRGVRAVLAVCALLVAAGALLVVAGPALPLLVVGSAAQALGCAGLTVTAMNLADSARRMGIVTASLAVVGSVSPLAGQVVADLASWRATLALPVVSLLAVPAAARRAMPPEPPGSRFDVPGAALVTGLVTALAALPHWPAPAAAAAVVTVLLLIVRLRARPDGFLPAALARSPRFLGLCGVGLALAVVNFGILYAAPTLLARHTGWTPAQIGTVMVVPYLLGGALSWLVVAASGRMRPGVVTALLIGAATAATVVVAFAGATPVLLAGMAAGSLAAASGQGVFAVYAGAVAEEHRPTAVGLLNLCYLLGAAFGPAITALMSA